MGVCEVMFVWIIATYIPFGICPLSVGNDGTGAGVMVCFGFAVNTP